jgi:hypothetical protein
MSYFSKFPLVKYPIKDGAVFRVVFARNLLRRIALSEDMKSSDSAFLEYDIKDGERPEQIAEKVYGDPTFHWIILLTNDVIDPYHGWYKSSSAMEEFIQKKHSGYSVFFTDPTDNFMYRSPIGAGSTLSQNTAQSRIKEYQPNLCKLLVEGSGFVAGAATVTVSGGTAYSVKIHRIDQSFSSVHHFESTRPTTDNSANEAVTLDPLSQQTSSYSVVGGVVGATQDEYPSNTQGIGYVGTGVVSMWETYIGRYMGISGSQVNTYAVSNYLYEMNENEKKRTIKILHPRFKREAVQELESLLRV